MTYPPRPAATHELNWHEDILGEDFLAADLPLGPDPDAGDGPAQALATVVHYRPQGFRQDPQRPALLWVHGMTDYFFQRHVAKHFYAAGYDFYAVDLRKCGRSHRRGQAWHYVSDLAHYFPDLAAAVDAIPNRNLGIIAHSTGGLIVPLWIDHLRRTDPGRHGRVKALILDSPWLAMMGIPAWLITLLKPALYSLSRLAPGIPIPGGGLTAFGESIHASEHGEWDYDLEFKPLGGHPKYLGWVGAIFRGFDAIHSGRVDAAVPVLMLCSAQSYLGEEYSPRTDTADVVIDVRQSQRWAKELSVDYTAHRIRGARHDVFLSQKPAREEAFSACDTWLARPLPPAAN